MRLRWSKGLLTGILNKIVSSHRMNAASSRSHCLFTLYCDVTSAEGGRDARDSQTTDKALVGRIMSKCTLVDFAGAQRVQRTDATGLLLQESIGINQSLFVLRKVIAALTDAQTAGAGVAGVVSSDDGGGTAGVAPSRTETPS